MNSKSVLKVLGTLLFLFGVFGYIFPNWHHTVFTNNENLFHVVTGLAAIMLASATINYRRYTLLTWAAVYLLLGIYGFALKHPADFHIKHITAQLDVVDNYLHILFGLAFAWYWLNFRKKS